MEMNKLNDLYIRLVYKLMDKIKKKYTWALLKAHVKNGFTTIILARYKHSTALSK